MPCTNTYGSKDSDLDNAFLPSVCCDIGQFLVNSPQQLHMQLYQHRVNCKQHKSKNNSG